MTFTVGLSTFIQWDGLTKSQRGLAICSILQSVSYTLQTLQYFKRNPLVDTNRWGGNRPLGERRAGIALNQVEGLALGEELGRLNIVPENLNDSQSTASSNSRRSSLSSEGSIDDFDGFGDLPPANNARRPAFNIGMALLKAFDVLVGVGFLVFLSMSLRDNWANMSTVEKLLGISQAVIQGLVVVVELTTIGLELATSLGFVGVQAASRALCCLSTIGAVLGVVALAVMISMIIYEATRPKPPTEAEKFAEANKGLVDGLSPSPEILLTYEIDKSSFAPASDQSITVTVTNKGQASATFAQLGFFFTAGGDTALFQGSEATKKDWNNTEPGSATTVAVAYSASNSATVSNFMMDTKPQPSTTVTLSGSLYGKQVGKSQTYESITLAPKEWIKLSFKGKIATGSGDVTIGFLEYTYPKDSKQAESSKFEIPIMKH